MKKGMIWMATAKGVVEHGGRDGDALVLAMLLLLLVLASHYPSTTLGFDTMKRNRG